MKLLRLVSWPYTARHVVRSVLTVAGIVLGVAVFVGMHTANQSVIRGFQRTLTRVAGATQLQVTSGDGGFPEDVLERAQGVEVVAVAVPVIEATMETGELGEGNLLVLAVDMTGDRSLRDYDFDSADEALIEDPLVFLAQPDSVMLTSDFAAKHGLALDSRLALNTVEGPRTFVVRGLMKSGGLTSAFGGNLAVMDIYAAQQVFGRGRTFDRIDVMLREGVTVERGAEAIRAALGPGFDVSPPSSRGEQIESTLSVYTTTVNISSVFALFIGMFIIYNAFSIAVTQRRNEIGILRALGATGGQIRGVFLLESLIGGLVGSALGVVAGLALARAMAVNIGGMLEGIYGLSQQPAELEVSTWVLVVAVCLGLVTSVLAALAPARAASHVDVVHALQKGGQHAIAPQVSARRHRVAAALAAIAVACLASGRMWWLFYLGYASTILCVLFMSPTLALWLVRGLRPVLRWIRPVEGTLAADSLLQSPRRTTATVAAVMLSLAQVIGIGGIANASYASIVDWVSTALNPDLFVTGSANISVRTFRFPPQMGDEIRGVEGVDGVERVRSVRVNVRGTPVLVVSVEVADIARRSPRTPVQGEMADMYARTARGEAVMISENLSAREGLSLGDVVDVPTPTGVLTLPIAGVIVDWSDQLGTIFMDREVFVRAWQDDSVNVFRVYLKPGASEVVVREGLRQRFAGERRAVVLTNGELRRYIMQLTDQWLGLTYVQLAVAVLVAILGIINTLTVSIIDRRRELGVLQAVGGLRSQIRGTIWLEAVTIACLGVVLGLALGAVNLRYVLEVAHRDIGGMRLDYLFPWTLALALVPTMFGAAWVAALAPGESAVRRSLVEALEYE